MGAARAREIQYTTTPARVSAAERESESFASSVGRSVGGPFVTPAARFVPSPLAAGQVPRVPRAGGQAVSVPASGSRGRDTLLSISLCTCPPTVGCPDAAVCDDVGTATLRENVKEWDQFRAYLLQS